MKKNVKKKRQPNKGRLYQMRQLLQEERAIYTAIHKLKEQKNKLKVDELTLMAKIRERTIQTTVKNVGVNINDTSDIQMKSEQVNKNPLVLDLFPSKPIPEGQESDESEMAD